MGPLCLWQCFILKIITILVIIIITMIMIWWQSLPSRMRLVRRGSLWRCRDHCKFRFELSCSFKNTIKSVWQMFLFFFYKMGLMDNFKDFLLARIFIAGGLSLVALTREWLWRPGAGRRWSTTLDLNLNYFPSLRNKMIKPWGCFSFKRIENNTGGEIRQMLIAVYQSNPKTTLERIRKFAKYGPLSRPFWISGYFLVWKTMVNLWGEKSAGG